MIRCLFCKQATGDPVEEDWTPYFDRGNREVDRPICPNCTSLWLLQDEDGELVFDVRRLEQN